MCIIDIEGKVYWLKANFYKKSLAAVYSK